MAHKIRATLPDLEGKERYKVIKAAMTQYNLAIEQGFFLEATALIESLICDRLESRLGELSKGIVEFDTLGNLLGKLRKKEKNPVLLSLLNNELNSWCGKRNFVIHQAAKIEQGTSKVWAYYIKTAKKTAKEGRTIFNTYNKELSRLRYVAKKEVTK